MKTINKKTYKGFTFVELLIVLMILSIISVGLFSYSMTISSTVAQNFRTLKFEAQLRTGIQRLTWIIRQFKSAEVVNSHEINFSYDMLGGYESSGTIIYDPSARTISVTYNSVPPQTEVILTEVDNVTFTYSTISKAIYLNDFTLSFVDKLTNKTKEFSLNMGVVCESLVL